MARITLNSLTTFGDLLRHLRRRSRLTQRELGIAVGYSEAHVARLENGQRLPDLTVVRTTLLTALGLENEPELATRLVELAEAAREQSNPDEVLPVIDSAKPRSNLPARLTRFIGRQHEISEVQKLLSQVRLLTLTGIGGVGKTRLSIQVSADCLAAYPDGVWFVEFAAITDPTSVTDVVLKTLDLTNPKRGAMETLVDFLRDKHVLLILDNCEHLISACAGLAETLLLACPELRLLATSREALNIPGETTWRVPSMASPEAVLIFADRAAAARPGFVLTEKNGPIIAQLCERLDGIPLAIELAASRLKIMSVDEIANRLDDRFALLTGGARTALPRHQTLRTLIDWSYGLLTDTERLLLQRLAIFCGGWTLEAAETVCTDNVLRPTEILRLLFDLVSKSLVSVDERVDETRYRLLETVREYGLERLRESGQLDSLRRKHACAYLALAERAESMLDGRAQQLWFERLSRERDNFNSVLEWSKASDGDAEAGLRLGGALWQFWLWGGSVREGRRHMDALSGDMPAGTPARIRARVLLGSSALTITDIQFDTHEDAPLGAHLDEAIDLFRQVADKEGLAIALRYRGYVAWRQHDPVCAKEFIDQSLAIARTTARPSIVGWLLADLADYANMTRDWTRAIALYEESLAAQRKAENGRGIAIALVGLGLVALRQRDFLRAREMSHQGLQTARQTGYKQIETQALMQIGESARYLGDYRKARMTFEEIRDFNLKQDEAFGIGFALQLLGKVASDEGDLCKAREFYLQSLAYRERMGDWSIPYNLEGLARVAGLQGNGVRAARLFGAAEALRTAMDWPLTSDNEPEHQRHIADVRAQLSAEAFDTAHIEGLAMTVDQAVNYALLLQ